MALPAKHVACADNRSVTAVSMTNAANKQLACGAEGMSNDATMSSYKYWVAMFSNVRTYAQMITGT